MTKPASQRASHISVTLYGSFLDLSPQQYVMNCKSLKLLTVFFSPFSCYFLSLDILRSTTFPIALNLFFPQSDKCIQGHTITILKARILYRQYCFNKVVTVPSI